MALQPALIAGHARTAKRWREIGTIEVPKPAEAATEKATRTPERELDIAMELRSLGHLAQRLATLSGSFSVVMLWATSWPNTPSRSTPMPLVPLGVTASILAVLLGVAALILEVITRLRIERSPELTTLAEHRRRIEAESAIFRESLPTATARPESRRARFARYGRNTRHALSR